jgi:hypothetical protein
MQQKYRDVGYVTKIDRKTVLRCIQQLEQNGILLRKVITTDNALREIFGKNMIEMHFICLNELQDSEISEEDLETMWFEKIEYYKSHYNKPKKTYLNVTSSYIKAVKDLKDYEEMQNNQNDINQQMDVVQSESEVNEIKPVSKRKRDSKQIQKAGSEFTSRKKSKSGQIQLTKCPGDDDLLPLLDSGCDEALTKLPKKKPNPKLSISTDKSIPMRNDLNKSSKSTVESPMKEIDITGDDPQESVTIANAISLDELWTMEQDLLLLTRFAYSFLIRIARQGLPMIFKPQFLDYNLLPTNISEENLENNGDNTAATELKKKLRKLSTTSSASKSQKKFFEISPWESNLPFQFLVRKYITSDCFK